MACLNNKPPTASTPYSAVLVPAQEHLSDQENQDPSAPHHKHPKSRPMEPAASPQPGLPTPTSDTSTHARGKKRKRVEVPAITISAASQEEEERRFNRYYNPDQDQSERRHVVKDSRALERQFNENRDEYLREPGGDHLREAVTRADRLFKTVKQTNDAVVDSRLLVSVSDLAYKKSAQLALGDASTGIDVDLFLSKCITFMRSRGSAGDSDGDDDDEPPSTRSQRRRTHTQTDEDEGEDDAHRLDWGLLGQHACFPYNARPPVPSFLLGPLSVQKKVRNLTQRRARQGKDNANQEARPEALTVEDLTQSDQTSLTTICEGINHHLRSHIKTARRAFRRENLSEEALDTERARQFFKKHRVTSTMGPSLFEYVINPHSFGQTVENLFYVSFLIKEGVARVEYDQDGLPTLYYENPVGGQPSDNAQKHQAVFSIDYATWQDLIQAFDIREPMIPHRDEQTSTQVGSRGWYA